MQNHTVRVYNLSVPNPENRTSVDPLQNLKILMEFFIEILSVFFTKVVPLLFGALFLVYFLFYLVFKFFGF